MVVNKILNDPGKAFQTAGQRVKRKLNRWLLPYLGGKTLCLERVVMVLTIDCNARCPYCFIWGKSGFAKNGEQPHFIQDRLVLSDCKNFIDDVCIHRPSFLMTGGELTMVPFWDEVAAHAKKRKLSVTLLSNGSFLEQNADKIIKSVDHLQISLDGPDVQLHDTCAGTDSFRKVVEGAQALDTMKKSKAQATPHLNFGFTVNEKNYQKMFETLTFIDSMGINVQEVLFLHQLFTDECALHLQKERIGRDISSFWRGFVQSPEIEPEEIVEQMEKIRRAKFKHIERVRLMPDFSPEEVKRFYTEPTYVPDRYKRHCSAPSIEIDLLPDGSLWTCADFVMGNVKEKRFSEIWNGEQFRSLRREISKNGTFPACRVCASLYEN